MWSHLTKPALFRALMPLSLGPTLSHPQARADQGRQERNWLIRRSCSPRPGIHFLRGEALGDHLLPHLSLPLVSLPAVIGLLSLFSSHVFQTSFWDDTCCKALSLSRTLALDRITCWGPDPAIQITWNDWSLPDIKHPLVLCLHSSPQSTTGMMPGAALTSHSAGS